MRLTLMLLTVLVSSAAHANPIVTVTGIMCFDSPHCGQPGEHYNAQPMVMETVLDPNTCRLLYSFEGQCDTQNGAIQFFDVGRIRQSMQDVFTETWVEVWFSGGLDLSDFPNRMMLDNVSVQGQWNIEVPRFDHAMIVGTISISQDRSQIATAHAPEPGTLGIIGVALLWVGMKRRRRPRG